MRVVDSVEGRDLSGWKTEAKSWPKFLGHCHSWKQMEEDTSEEAETSSKKKKIQGIFGVGYRLLCCPSLKGPRAFDEYNDFCAV